VLCKEKVPPTGPPGVVLYTWGGQSWRGNTKDGFGPASRVGGGGRKEMVRNVAGGGEGREGEDANWVEFIKPLFTD